MSDELLAELLSKPIGPALAPRPRNATTGLTREIRLTDDTAAVTVRGPQDAVTEDAAADYLRAQGHDPADWTVTGLRSSEWTMPGGKTGVSTKYTFARTSSAGERPSLDELFNEIHRHDPAPSRPDGDHGFLILLGDMQFGKIDGDGPGGTLGRTVGCLNRAADLLVEYRRRFDIGHVHVAWLGDHIEGFVSQGGANTWRTQLTLNEQIRLTRRVMLHALVTLAPLASRLTMAAVPGNHGEAVRFGGKGLTRYDDSHDTESLIAVADAAALNPQAFGHAEFYVPRTDELTVVVDVAGTRIAHAHGHQWKPGHHFDWWRSQAFNANSAMHDANLLLAGHLHHLHVDTDGPRTFIQPPAMESESTWWRHATGTGGAPGLVVGVTKSGLTSTNEIVR